MIKNKKRRSWIFFMMVFISVSCYSQAGFTWASAFSGGLVRGWAVKTDKSGNVYTTGEFQGSVDFDPGAGQLIFTVPPATNPDVFVSKLDASGSLVWARHFAGDQTIGYGITVDKWGGVYTTGYFSGTVDFDPGSGSYNLSTTGPSDWDPFICKLSPSGNFLWAVRFSGSTVGAGADITNDSLGNIYSTGSFQGIMDMDPSAATYTVIAGGVSDTYVSKIDTGGNFMWGKNIDGTNQVEAHSLAYDSASACVYVSGNFNGSADFDPGASTFSMTAAASVTVFNSYVCKLTASAGSFVWAKQFGGNGCEVTTNQAGDVYCGGYFQDVADFDPGPSTYTLASNGQLDMFVLKLDALGNLNWVKQVGGTNFDYIYSITADNQNNVFVTGDFIGNVDFDPGPGTFALNSISGSTHILQLSSAGNFVWAGVLTGVNGGYAIWTDRVGSIYVTGIYDTNTDFNPGAGTYTLNASNADDDAYVLKLCYTVPVFSQLNGANPACAGGIYPYTVSSLNSSAYSWSLPPVWTTTTSAGSFSAHVVSGGVAILTASNSCGINTQSFTITTVNAPTVTANNGTICAGQPFYISPSGAGSYSVTGGSFTVSPLATTAYSVVGTSTNGCISNTAISTVSVLALPVITVNSGTICEGNSYTITPAGAATYTVQGGTTVLSPSVSAIYTVAGTGANGCTNNTQCSILVDPSPTVTITSKKILICKGEAATLSVSGALSFTWSTSSQNTLVVVSPTTTTTYSVSGAAANSCKDSASVTLSVSDCLGLKESVLNDNVTIYPNPGNGIFNVNSNRECRMEVINTLGVTLLTETLSYGTFRLDLRNEAAGIYYVKIYSAGETNTFKLVRDE